MRRDLFIIPHEFAGIPVFGVGWALAAWLVFGGVLLVYAGRQQGWGIACREHLPILILGGMAIVFLLPRMELTQELGGRAPTIGLPIRGYGALLLLAALAGVGDATWRARRIGLSDEIIHALAFWMFAAGLIGARAFFVIKEWPQFYSPHIGVMIGNVLNVTQGGLVVYGSLAGAMLAAIVFLLRRGLPVLAMLDVIAPSMVLGLAIGRLGCLMNGCCFGDLCNLPWGITFPPDSPPYEYQHAQGAWHGMRLDEGESGTVRVGFVVAGGLAETAGLRVGDVLVEVNGQPLCDTVRPVVLARAWLSARDEANARGTDVMSVQTADGRRIAWSIPADWPPRRSLSVHPTQVYSAVKAGLLYLVLITFYPLRRRDGQVLACLLILYPISRFVVEILRGDCPPVGMTGLTIAQVISVPLLAVGLGLWLYLWVCPRPLARLSANGWLSSPQGTVGAAKAS